MRRVVVIKAHTPPDVFKTGKKIIVKKLPATAVLKKRPRSKAHNEEVSQNVIESHVVTFPPSSHEKKGTNTEEFFRSESVIQVNTDESSEWEESENDKFSWEPRRAAEIIAKHRHVNNYVQALKVEVNTLHETIRKLKESYAIDESNGIQKHAQTVMKLQEDIAVVTRAFKRSVRQCVRLKLRLEQLGARFDESVVESISPDVLPAVLSLNNNNTCDCSSAIAIIVEALEDLIPSHETKIWEQKFEEVCFQRDKLANEIVSLRNRVAEIQLIVAQDPFLSKRIMSEPITLDINCALTSDEQKIILQSKIQNLEIQNAELESQLVHEKNLSRQWIPELRRIETIVSNAFVRLLGDRKCDGYKCKIASRLQNLAKTFSLDDICKRSGKDDILHRQIREDSIRIQYYVKRLHELESQIVSLTEFKRPTEIRTSIQPTGSINSDLSPNYIIR